MLSKGLAYEKIAQKHLQTKGLKTVTKNFRTRFGEIDLIMRDKDTLVFVEVKFRTNGNYGGALESITLSKQKKLVKTANIYLAQSKQWNSPCRFDAVLISNNKSKLQDDIHWIKSAFYAF